MQLSRVLSSRRMAQTFTVYRKGGSWVAGRWNGTETPIQMTGVITVPSETDVEQVPEGDRQRGAICVYTAQPLMITNAGGTSDEILWRGQRYRAAKVWPYADYGYYKCIAVRMDDV
ncbi:hypothetical protein [Alicyclobacillus macrosporangiidus]|nr:hypothetical protein [Alicyclobacillus macrosporangiidus]